VTTISETRDLTTLTTTTLFGKLREHELEMIRLKEMETTEKKIRISHSNQKLLKLKPVRTTQKKKVILKVSIY